MIFEISIFGRVVFSISLTRAERVPEDAVSLGANTERADDEDDEPYGFAMRVD